MVGVVLRLGNWPLLESLHHFRVRGNVASQLPVVSGPRDQQEVEWGREERGRVM